MSLISAWSKMGSVTNNDERIEIDDYSSQIRSLRLILGGKKFRAISVKAFASLCRIPVRSLMSIEAGRRKLNEQDSEKIAIYLGAKWNQKSQNWVAQDDKTPYTRKHYEMFSNKVLISFDQIQSKQAAFCNELANSLEHLDPRDAWLVLSRLEHVLQTMI